MTVQPPGQPPEDLTAQWQQWTVPGTAVPAVPAAAAVVAAAVAADAVLDDDEDGDGPDPGEDMNEYLTQKFAEEGALNAATQAQWDTFNQWS